MDQKNRSFSTEELEEELRYEKEKDRKIFSARNTVGTLLVAAAAVTLLVVHVFPIIRIRGASMEPGLTENDVVLVKKQTDLEPGDIAVFYFNSSIVVKRVIAVSGDVVIIDDQGNVSVNGETLQEPYVYEKSLEDCSIAFPYKVRKDCYFLLGDHRSVSIDSRNSAFGSIPKEQITGKALFVLWPLSHMGSVTK